jgi:lipopolysaccharide export system protein LptC
MRNKKWKIVLILLIAISLGVIFVIVLKQKQSPTVGINLISPVYGAHRPARKPVGDKAADWRQG